VIKKSPKIPSEATKGAAPHPRDFLRLVRGLVNDDDYEWTIHALDERSDEREIHPDVALDVISKGYIRDPITPGKYSGEWIGKIVDTVGHSSRMIGVVTVLIRNKKVLIATVEWEDP
jgi:hypothetical protein